MLGPADYWSAFQGIADPIERAMQGYAFGDSVAQAEQQRQIQQQQMEAARQQQMLKQQERQRFFSLPNPSSKDFMRFISTLDPKEREGLKGGWDAMTTEQQNNDFNYNAQVAMAFKSNRPDLAEKLVQERAVALRNAKDEMGARDAEAFAKMVAAEPDYAKKIVTGRLFAIDEKRAKPLFEDQRADELQGSAVEKAAGDAAKATADATTAQVQAKYAEPKTIGELKKLAADLGLTKAQTAQAFALTRKYDAETQKLALEAANGDPTKNFEFEKKLRDEFTKDTQGFRDTKDAHARILASDNTAAGDISLIFGYMKMLDPGSVVREGEFATAQNAAGVPDRIRNAWNRALSGERLSATQRKEFIGQANSLYMAASKRESEARQRISKIATRYKLDTGNIFGDDGGDSGEPAAPAATQPATTTPRRQAATAGAPPAAPATSSNGWSVRRIN